MPEAADVLVAGAGPAGLALAVDLAAAGLHTIVLADGSDHAAAGAAPGAAVVHARSLEHLDALGVADALVRAGQALGRVSARQGIGIDLTMLPTRFPFALVAPRYQIERVLASRASSLGARLIGAGRIGAVRQDAEGTRLTTRAPGGDRVFAAPYLVGADCAGGAVRAALGSPPGILHGRVILAGQAARPCDAYLTGDDVEAALEDAANLGWKLAAVLRSGADPGLLGSYARERGEADGLQARLARALLPPAGAAGPPGGIVTAAVATIISRGPAAGLAGLLVSGLWRRYRRGDRCHRLAGRRAADIALHGRHARLYEALRERRPVLLISADLQPGSEVAALLSLWRGRVAACATDEAPALLTLVCPDGYIGWASDSRSPARRYAELRQALGDYCGPPRTRVPAR